MANAEIWRGDELKGERAVLNHPFESRQVRRFRTPTARLGILVAGVMVHGHASAQDVPDFPGRASDQLRAPKLQELSPLERFGILTINNPPGLVSDDPGDLPGPDVHPIDPTQFWPPTGIARDGFAAAPSGDGVFLSIDPQIPAVPAPSTIVMFLCAGIAAPRGRRA